MKRVKCFSVLLALVILLSAFPFAAFAQAKAFPAPDLYGFLDLGDTRMEYGVYGDEALPPLLILTGNGGDMHGHDGNILPGLLGKYRIITLSTRGTGNTYIGEQHLTFELEAQDVKALLDELNIEKTDIYGFSDGANLGIVFTLMYPETVNRLCIQSPNINISGTKLKTQLQIMWQYFILCIECAIKTDPDFVRQREIKGMMANQPNLEYEDLNAITCPVLHIYADNDMMYTSHSEKISAAIPDCKDLVIVGGTHTSSFAQSNEVLVPALTEFFVD